MNNLSATTKRRDLSLPRLYAILDPERCKGRPPPAVIDDLLRGGCRAVQLRVKNGGGREFYDVGLGAAESCRAAGALFIVNDRVDVALAVKADGVHLGQDDLPIACARKLVGENALIGISTHTLEQAREAEENGADYIGFGPVFGTATKETGYEPRGLDLLSRVCATVRLPVVAIGGITEQNVAAVWGAGARSAAMIGELMAAGDIAAKTRTIVALAEAG
jgi:thiamine-phosphate diphosphorylase